MEILNLWKCPNDKSDIPSPFCPPALPRWLALATGQTAWLLNVRSDRAISFEQDAPVAFHHFRDKDGVEVDMVIEASGQRIAGIEVKAAATVTAADFRGLRKLQESTGKNFAAGVVLYDGEVTAPFGDRLNAVPIRCLWETI